MTRVTTRMMAAAVAAAAWLPVLAWAAEPGDYVLGPRDVLEVKVYEQPDLQQVVKISDEGLISLPLIGELKAAGLTLDRLTRIITEKYTEYIYHPQVSLAIREYHSMQIYLLGEVKKPGVYQLTGNATLLELLSQAGGIAEAGGDTINIIHRPEPGGVAETVSVNLTGLLEAGSPGGNLEVLDGDTIYVPRADYFFVFGEVNKPGSYKLDKEMKLTVMKAISLAGGFTEKAAKGKIRITREDAGGQITFKTDLNGEVRPQDIVIVPESFF